MLASLYATPENFQQRKVTLVVEIAQTEVFDVTKAKIEENQGETVNKVSADVKLSFYTFSNIQEGKSRLGTIFHSITRRMPRFSQKSCYTMSEMQVPDI